MKLLRKSLLVPTCLTLLTSSSQAALVLEFREIEEGRVELTFSGTLDFPHESFVLASPRANQNGFEIFITPVRDNLLSFHTRGSGISNTESFSGLFIDDIDIAVTNPVSIFGSFGLELDDSAELVLFFSGDNDIAGRSTQSLTSLSAEPGGSLFEKSVVFDTSLVRSGLGTLEANTLINIWRPTGSTGGDGNVIALRVNTTTIPEPSSLIFCSLGLLSLVPRRSRKT